METMHESPLRLTIMLFRYAKINFKNLQTKNNVFAGSIYLVSIRILFKLCAMMSLFPLKTVEVNMKREDPEKYSSFVITFLLKIFLHFQ